MNQKPRGTKDIFGQDMAIRNLIVKTLVKISESFNYQQLETPIFENSNVFIKSVGETSDIVLKEMYSFQDKGNRSMTLRPEGTAGAIRAIVENKLYTSLPLKIFYYGPMFRYENPQRGRQRQFTQYGVEVLGAKSPLLDAEVILTAVTILESLNIPFELHINSLGDAETRARWTSALKVYFQHYQAQLTPQSQQRIMVNPLRILDDKEDGQKDFVLKAPQIKDFYSQATKDYFNQLQKFLKTMGINFKVNHQLVRGLDYYSETAFEFISISDEAGSQGTIIGGGRYEKLVEDFGGPQLSGIGFGLGIERLVNELKPQFNAQDLSSVTQIYVMNIDVASAPAALGVVYLLRRAGFNVAWNYQATKIQKAFAKADKSGALVKIISGPKEIAQNAVVVKYQNQQETVLLTQLVAYLTHLLGEKHETN